MKLSKTTIIITIILSVILFLTGMSSHSLFFKIMLPNIDGVYYHQTSLTQGFGMSLIYSFTLALIPAVTIQIWKYARIHSVIKKVFVPLILITCILTATILRRSWINAEAKKMAETTQLINDQNNEQIKSFIPLSHLNFENYMFAGFLAGIAISYLTMREKL